MAIVISRPELEKNKKYELYTLVGFKNGTKKSTYIGAIELGRTETHLFKLESGGYCLLREPEIREGEEFNGGKPYVTANTSDVELQEAEDYETFFKVEEGKVQGRFSEPEKSLLEKILGESS
jgi:hypothetical protein